MIIAAGGRGLRMGGRLPKQFLPLLGTPVLLRTLGHFDSVKQVKRIVVVVPTRYASMARRMLRGAQLRKPWRVVRGGTDRQGSVRNGLRALGAGYRVVLVQDAVRPLVQARVINAVILAARRHGAAVTAVPANDTITVEGRKGFATATLKRDQLWAVQTPQGFRRGLLLEAHRKARKEGFLGTDEASLVERLGVPVRIVRGDYANMKITTRDDMALAAHFLRSRVFSAESTQK